MYDGFLHVPLAYKCIIVITAVPNPVKGGNGAFTPGDIVLGLAARKLATFYYCSNGAYLKM